VAEWVRQGPTLEQHKVVRWRLVDLRDEIARKFGVQLHERTVGKLMARSNSGGRTKPASASKAA